MAVSKLCLFVTLPWVGLQCVIVVLSGHTQILVVVACAGFCIYFFLSVLVWQSSDLLH